MMQRTMTTLNHVKYCSKLNTNKLKFPLIHSMLEVNHHFAPYLTPLSPKTNGRSEDSFSAK